MRALPLGLVDVAFIDGRASRATIEASAVKLDADDASCAQQKTLASCS